MTDVTALAVDSAGALYVGSPGNFVNTLPAGGAAWTAATSGPKSVGAFFFDTTPATTVVYAAGQDDGTTLVGGVWSGPISTVVATATVAWTLVGTTGVTKASTATGFGGLVTNGLPLLFAGTSFTAGQQYANLFRNPATSTTVSDWILKADGIIGGNVLAVTLPNTSGAALTLTGSSALAATSGAGIFKTTTSGQ